MNSEDVRKKLFVGRIKGVTFKDDRGLPYLYSENDKGDKRYISIETFKNPNSKNTIKLMFNIDDNQYDEWLRELQREYDIFVENIRIKKNEIRKRIYMEQKKEVKKFLK